MTADREKLVAALTEISEMNPAPVGDTGFAIMYRKCQAIARAALSQSPLPGEGWRPIETAPTDGTDLLLASTILDDAPGGPFYGYVVGAWDVEDVGGDGGWATDSGLERIHPQPMYWHPLPAPPSAASPQPPHAGEGRDDLCAAPGAADLTFGSLLVELIGGGYRRVETADPNSRHRVYTECKFCGGSDEDRATGQRPQKSLVKHDTKCALAKHLPRLNAMANKDVT